MSLLIIGSCSKITSNVILALTKHSLYQSITIADPLPLYSHHERYYKLRKHLNEQRSSTPVHLDKLINVESLSKHVNNHRDVLYITHDYFATVTSKQKLMELTARLTTSVRHPQLRNKMSFLLPLSNTITMDKTILNRLT